MLPGTPEAGTATSPSWLTQVGGGPRVHREDQPCRRHTMGRRGTREGEESLKFLGRSITPGNWRPGRWVLQQAGVRLGKRRRQKPGGGWEDRRPARGEEGLTSNRGKERMGRF